MSASASKPPVQERGGAYLNTAPRVIPSTGSPPATPGGVAGDPENSVAASAGERYERARHVERKPNLERVDDRCCGPFHRRLLRREEHVHRAERAERDDTAGLGARALGDCSGPERHGERAG